MNFQPICERGTARFNGVYTARQSRERDGRISVYPGMFTKYLRSCIFLAVSTAPFVSIAQPAPATAAEEHSNVSAGLVILQNEILNNDEERYLILGPNSDYFIGFDEAMNDVIGQIESFALTGDEVTDFTALNTSFMASENAAFAGKTELDRGRGTAYLYATVVLDSDVLSTFRNPVAFEAQAKPSVRTPSTSVRPARTPVSSRSQTR